MRIVAMVFAQHLQARDVVGVLARGRRRRIGGVPRFVNGVDQPGKDRQHVAPGTGGITITRFGDAA